MTSMLEAIRGAVQTKRLDEASNRGATRQALSKGFDLIDRARIQLMNRRVRADIVSEVGTGGGADFDKVMKAINEASRLLENLEIEYGQAVEMSGM
jgi:hypothetical protein